MEAQWVKEGRREGRDQIRSMYLWSKSKGRGRENPMTAREKGKGKRGVGQEHRLDVEHQKGNHLQGGDPLNPQTEGERTSATRITTTKGIVNVIPIERRIGRGAKNGSMILVLHLDEIEKEKSPRKGMLRSHRAAVLDEGIEIGGIINP